MYGQSKQNSNTEDEGDTGKQTVSTFLDVWGWEYAIDQCRENAGIPEDQVYTDWNVIQLMNKMSYLKDKGKFEIAIRK